MYRKFLMIFLVFLLGNVKILCAVELPVVFVSIVPQKYFVKQLAGDLVKVEVMVPPGANPATYEPRPSQMIKLAKAKAYYSIGVPFEAAWLPRLHATNSHVTLVKTDAGIKKQSIDSSHNHGETGAAQHINYKAIADPHIWLSPALVKKQATTIANSLISFFPDHTAKIEKRLESFLKTTEALDQELHQLFRNKKGSRFMVFHPSWGYFAHEYDLKQEPVEISGKSPKPAQLAALVTKARNEGITMILVQPQFSLKSAKLIAKEIGGRVVIADPLAFNWFDNLRHVAHLIAEKK